MRRRSPGRGPRPPRAASAAIPSGAWRTSRWVPPPGTPSSSAVVARDLLGGEAQEAGSVAVVDRALLLGAEKRRTLDRLDGSRDELWPHHLIGAEHHAV